MKGMARFKPKGLAPQDKSPVPISAQAVAFAVSEPLRDLPDAKAAAGEMDIEVEGHEINQQNTIQPKIARAGAGLDKLPSLDGALQGPKPIESDTPSVPSLTFDGIADTDNIPLIGGRVAPSDENLDVGRNDVVQTVNDALRIWDKNGNPKTAPKLISSLFRDRKSVV